MTSTARTPPHPHLRPNPRLRPPTQNHPRTLHTTALTTKASSAWRLARLPLAALAAVSALYATTSQPYRINGHSMQPTLQCAAPDRQADWVLAARRIERSTVPRGAVILLRSPTSRRIAVKRVVGVAGDRVRPLAPPSSVVDADEDKRAARTEMRDAYLASLGRGEVTSATSSTGQLPLQGQDGTLAPLTVPFGHVWVEGDNAASSVDSNTYGPVSRSLILGVVWARWAGLFTVRRVDFQGDGWEGRMGGRLEKGAAEEQGFVPLEWRMD